LKTLRLHRYRQPGTIPDCSSATTDTSIACHNLLNRSAGRMSRGNPVTPPGTGPAKWAGPSTIGSVLPTPSDHAHNRLADADHQCARGHGLALLPNSRGRFPNFCFRVGTWKVFPERKSPVVLLRAPLNSLGIEHRDVGKRSRTENAAIQQSYGLAASEVILRNDRSNTSRFSRGTIAHMPLCCSFPTRWHIE